MNDLNLRLREERNRLGFTQDAFAKLCGVARRAQASYEAGERFPDAKYLIQAAKAGVNTRFVLSGFKGDAAEMADFAVEALLRSLCRELKIPELSVDENLVEARKVLQQKTAGYGAMHSFDSLAQRLTEKSARLIKGELVLILNSDMLVDIIRELELSLARLEAKSVSPSQKALKICSLYRMFTEKGEIDLGLVQSAAANLNQ
jgi:transcriptional regulator with XRE-family HTH domain